MVCEACFANKPDIYRLHYTGTPLRQSVRANSHPHYLIGNYTFIQCVGPLVCITAVLVVAILQKFTFKTLSEIRMFIGA